METGWRGGERRLREAGSLQEQGPRVGATGQRADQRSRLEGCGGSMSLGLGWGSRVLERLKG